MYRNMYQKLLSVLLSAVFALTLTGCWDHVEISRMLILAGIGLDVDDTGSTYQATVQVVNVEAEGGENIAAEIVEGEGETMHDAIQNAMLMTGGTMFGNHCKVVVIGDRLARKGINEVVEMILRSPDFRKTVDILVAKDDTARTILGQKTVKNDITSYELSEILRSNSGDIKNTVSTGMYELHEELISSCPYFVSPAVSVRKNREDDVLEVDGCALFADERLQGFLDGSQSKLLHLITGNVRDVTIPLENTTLSEKPVDLNIIKSDVYLYPRLQNGALSLHVFIAAEASLRDAVLSGANVDDSAFMEQAERSVNERLSGDILELIREVQSSYGADIFQFYRQFEDHYRQEWPALSEDWESRFQGMTVSVETDVKITGSGLIGNYEPNTDSQYNANALP